MNTANKNAQKIASAQGKEISSCIKDGAKGKLTGTIETCTTSDPKGKVAKAKTQYGQKTAKDCASGSGFIALADPNTVTQRAMDKELSIIHWVFGSDLDTAVFAEETNKANSKCQQDVAKAIFKCQDTKWKEYNSCKKNKLKGKGSTKATNSTELQDECLGTNGTNGSIPDPKGKIAKKCDFTGTINKKCPNLNVYPGCPGVRRLPARTDDRRSAGCEPRWDRRVTTRGDPQCDGSADPFAPSVSRIREASGLSGWLIASSILRWPNRSISSIRHPALVDASASHISLF